ncbi:hypothetical protein BKA00_001812 [Actinomadura coerulea]|uniref:DUF4132 domain-containing protein n=1 Tax=Actinomadura coerulea TaxID=46159 RepID=A0A7X0FWB7_9ACTN|nr:DUF4132 domain-containing protein [Actinomadura coerulea]MBB6394898.1 hypothetical protein [Actinomadura coerulea]GGQ31316.1 hypothetical protein GCM10010187_55150 [Actinomadura coerulea]
MDEETMIIPASWRRRLHPRRGGEPGTALRLDPSAGDALAEKIRAQSADVEDVLGAPRSDPALVQAARRYLGGEDDPLGAAVVGQIAFREESWQEDPYTWLVDAWCAGRGAAFAAAAVAGIVEAEPARRWVEHGVRMEAWIRPRDPQQHYGQWWVIRKSLARMRAVLASADDDEYERAVARLGECRGTPLLRRVTAYLAPTRQDWVDASLAESGGTPGSEFTWMLWCSVASPAQLPRLGPLEWLAASDELVATAVDGVGAALAPLLADAYDTASNAKARKNTAEALAVLPTDEAFQALADRAHQDRVRPALAAAAERFPVRAARLLSGAAAGTGKAAAVAAGLLEEHLLTHPELGEGKARRARVPDAPARELPACLVNPPWRRPRRERRTVVIDGLAPPDVDAVRWARGEREAWSASGRWRDRDEWAARIHDHKAGRLAYWQTLELFTEGPEELVRPLFAEWAAGDPPLTWNKKQIAARYELDAAPLLVKTAADAPASDGEILLPFLTPAIAALMADWALRLKSARPIAHAWFARHRIAAALQLVPAALGPAGGERRAAQLALLHIAGNEGADAVVEAARVHGARAAAAIADLMTADALDLVPPRPPAIGGWADPALLPQVLTARRDRALPAAATRDLLRTLALEAPDGGRPDLAEVERACDPESLAAFSWAVFERWEVVGHPPRDGWALTQLGLLGGDEAARRLTPLIRAWPGQSRHKNAAAGLDVLAEIGTDVALLHLHGISQRLRFKTLKERARQKIDQIADELGLTDDELADRLAPDLGLDAAGTLVLDYGPRRFTVGFDEQLRPYVLDGTGRPRKTLPRPGAKDDPDLAPAAHKRFAALRKDARAVAAGQVRRLEAAMIQRRSWTFSDFQRLLAGHPLLRHIVRRLVWLTGDGTAFRVAEDGTLADSADDALVLDGTARVRVAHRLDLDARGLAAWAQVFADYEIAQPFPQLDRPVHALTDDERRTGRLARFDGAKVPLGRLLRLESDGWEHEMPADAGIVGGMSRTLPGGATAWLGFEPGVAIGHRDPDQIVTIGAHVTGTLDALQASELLAELTAVTEG